MGIGYVRPVQFLDHLTVIKTLPEPCSGLSNLDATLATSEKTFGRQSDEKRSPFILSFSPPPFLQLCDPPCATTSDAASGKYVVPPK